MSPLSLIFPLIILFSCACQPSTDAIKTKDRVVAEPLEIDSVPKEVILSPRDLGIILDRPEEPYLSVKQRIALEKKELLVLYNQGEIDLDSVRYYFTEQLLNQIIPYWYGMPWDFSGYSAIPGEGTVGCSYFVSTTLVHMGLNVNRYKLAQKGPLDEAKALVLTDTVMEMELLDFEEDNLKDGFYFVGLSVSHVGYLLKRQGHWFFIQSNYDSPQEVLLESLPTSSVFNSYNQFYVVPLTWNNAFIKAWLNGTQLRV